MKIENIPADIKSKSLKEARNEINEILIKLETENLDINSSLIQPVKEIKSIGKFKIIINLHSEVQTQIYINVTSDEKNN